MEASLKRSTAELVVYIEPSKTSSISSAVNRQLNSCLFKFNEIFGGVLLAFDYIVKSKLAKILSIYPYVAVTLKANLLLFAPKPQTFLEGKVLKLTPESIYIVVLGFSAALITNEHIRDEFKYKVKHGREVFSSTTHKRHIIKVGSMIRFVVNSFDEETLHISGSLLPPATGCIRWLSKNSEELIPTARSSRKQAYNVRGKDAEDELCSEGFGGGASSSSYHISKKAKRQRVYAE